MPTRRPPPPPLDPPPGIRSDSVQVLSDLIHNPRDAHAANDASPDIVMTSASEPRRLPETRLPASHAAPATEPTPASFLRSLLARPEHQTQDGKLVLDAMLMTLLLQLLDSKAEQKRMVQLAMEEMRQTLQEMKRAMADLRELPGRVTTIKAGQLPLLRNDGSQAESPTPPPTKTEMVAAQPGLTIIHARTGTAPLKEVGAEITVRRVNEVLDKLNATVQGERVSVKAVRFLPSGDVSFYSKNRQQKEWLNCNKHEWSKQVHPDLEASPSTYSVLAHGIPRTFNVDAATSRISIALDNNFLAKKIFKM
ncbi:hypothetical protein PTTG_29773 [Puccinia triticina 1-1 BBBD Race 1]|uniref:Uncharacterized protein n=1 Tax=Puccinia triticina (isolate 1-1 / race 1 (BBBD)) TaxID=630390 RepID=A0A180G214_PUCT1|nr:hypothetical protein PTTG_29773 [Puccinia triticina 1-1 BBBD Race 1]